MTRRADDVASIGIDEKALLTRPRYGTLVVDVMPERTEESLLFFSLTWNPARLANIQMIAMDRWGPYETAPLKMVLLA